MPQNEMWTIRQKITGVLLRQARVDSGKTLKECGRALGLSSSALSAIEQRLEHSVEILAHGGERLDEHLSGRNLDLTQCLVQRIARRNELVALTLEELEALLFLSMLLNGQRVDRSNSLEFALEALGLHA